MPKAIVLELRRRLDISCQVMHMLTCFVIGYKYLDMNIAGYKLDKILDKILIIKIFQKFGSLH